MNIEGFDPKKSLFEITEDIAESKELLISLGFDNMKDEAQRRRLGKAITLEMALKSKNMDIKEFERKLEERIQENQEKNEDLDKPKLSVAGVLPCPVKIPLMEGFEAWMADNDIQKTHEISVDLRVASMGVDWIKEDLLEKGAEFMPDLVISAGFDLFFDPKLFGKYREQDYFEDFTSIEQYNKDFDNDEIQLKDPKGHYALLAVVPAVFVANENVLEAPVPTSWEMLLNGDYEGQVGLPIGDFDLFNAILLNVYKKFGEEGIVRLKKALFHNMHPSQMVKSDTGRQEKPGVTIMPYFFTKMLKEGGPMKAVWPEDGAIISPIFMLGKKAKKEQLKPLGEFFGSKEVGEILSHNGRFPSVHPQVDNQISKENTYMWLGWDYIKEHDIAEKIALCEKIFQES
ncbi:MAG TPA: iron ABC transporter substrate-binding protein [Eubacteriaceae bacterium]|nr:iron ABC transporter substrate-binding protein [Eubacteriaceae bacterium]